MAKRRNPAYSGGLTDYDRAADNSDTPTMNGDKLEAVKEAEKHGESARLDYEEAKAKHQLAKAELKLVVARRNIVIARSDDSDEIKDAQRKVENAASHEDKVKALRDAMRDEWKGSEEKLAKVLTEELPLFD